MSIDAAKWYVLHTYSGYESMVKDSIEKLIENNNLQDFIYNIEIPIEQYIEEKNGKRKVSSRKMYPCYVFIKLIYTNDIWYLVTNTRGVTGFVGPGGRPLPLTDEEVKRMQLEKIVIEADFAIGDNVKVISGYLENWDDISFEDKRLVVDGLILKIHASSGDVKIEWKI